MRAQKLLQCWLFHLGHEQRIGKPGQFELLLLAVQEADRHERIATGTGVGLRENRAIPSSGTI